MEESGQGPKCISISGCVVAERVPRRPDAGIGSDSDRDHDCKSRAAALREAVSIMIKSVGYTSSTGVDLHLSLPKRDQDMMSH